MAMAQARLRSPKPIRPEYALLEFLAQGHGDFVYWTDRMRVYASNGDDVLYHEMLRAREVTAKHTASIAATILSAGIAERQVRLVEGMAARDASVIREFCDRIGLSDEQLERAPDALRSALLMVGPRSGEDSIDAEWEEDV